MKKWEMYASEKTAFFKRFFYVSNGNKKLKPNKETRFLIWSLPAIKTCPYATEMCKGACYARKAEKQYPNALRSRERNLEFSRSADFVDIMTAYIHKRCKHYLYRRADRIVFRMHESGDFYSREYFEKWAEIARNCADIPNLIFMGYTKSLPFVHDIPANMVIRSSVWADTAREMLEITERENYPIYTAVPKFTTETDSEKCECLDCGTCNKCWCKDVANHVLKCEIH